VRRIRPVRIAARNAFNKSIAYGDDWELAKKAIPLKGACCERCGSTHHLQRHHFIPRSKYGSHAKYNIQILCDSCHELLHAHMRKKVRKIRVRQSYHL
jgi:5-methylcytosine-specific restriction endonuclease McrA